MELVVKGFAEEDYVIEVGEKDTTETMRKKVASATGLCEDSFRMGFGGKEEGEDITELSAGDTVVLTKKSKKYEAIAALHALGETDFTEVRLTTVRDPGVASLLLQAEVATVIPNGFLVEVNTLTTLDLSAASGVTHIGNDFLRHSTRLTKVDLSGLGNVRRIGNGFLYWCPKLDTVDLSGFGSVARIGNSFLCSCARLTRLDLSALRGLTHIGHGFLMMCSRLAVLVLPRMCGEAHVGALFLNNCTALTALNASGLANVTQIESKFINCAALRTLDLSGLANVTQVGADFLSNCDALTELDLSGSSRALSQAVPFQLRMRCSFARHSFGRTFLKMVGQKG